MILLGVNGYAQAGKDTFADALVRHAGYERFAFADALRALAVEVNPILAHIDSQYPGTVRYAEALENIGYRAMKDRYDEAREFLQRLGVGVRNVLGEDAWVRAAMKDFDPNGRYVCTDMRFPNEMDAIKSAGGYTVRVLRPGVGPVNNHISEVALDGATFDYLVHNDGDLALLYDRALRVHDEVRRRTAA